MSDSTLRPEQTWPGHPNPDPSANGNAATSNLQNMRDSVLNSRVSASSFTADSSSSCETGAQSTLNSIQNHPTTQNMKSSLSDGPVAENVRNQAAKTSDEFSALADSKRTPDHPAATGQELTHYHSLFFNLLSWENPRATAVTFLANILFIFAARYLHISRYLFKFTCYVLGVTAGAEIVGKVLFGNGFASQIRPRKYYTVDRESLNRVLADIDQLVNFFVIEFQRILFAENIYATVAVFLASFISYWLVKFVPIWGLSLIGTTVLYLAPLVYVTNKDLIDAQLDHASEMISQQTAQIMDITSHHASRATETAKTYASDYTAKAQEYMGTASRKSSTSTASKPQRQSTHESLAGKVRSEDPLLHQTDFPNAPSSEPAPLSQTFEYQARREDPLLSS